MLFALRSAKSRCGATLQSTSASAPTSHELQAASSIPGSLLACEGLAADSNLACSTTIRPRLEAERRWAVRDVRARQVSDAEGRAF